MQNMSISHGSDVDFKWAMGGGPGGPGGGYYDPHVLAGAHAAGGGPGGPMGGGLTMGCLPYQNQMESSNLTEAYVQALMMAR